MSQIVKVEVKADHLQSQTHTKKPIIALEELIWNGLDADATRVDVKIIPDDLGGGIGRITVRDNGHGLAHDEALDVFKSLGGSWKKFQAKSKTKERCLHGRMGKGRFRAFSLGSFVEWNTTFQDEGQVKHYSIKGSQERLGEFEVLDPKDSEQETGTTVVIDNIHKNFTSLAIFNLLKQEKDAIESELSGSLVWEEKPGKKNSHIILRNPG